MYGLLATASTTPIIAQIAWIIGKLMDWIYTTLGVHNIGWCIIILTVIIYTLMIPLTIKQQKFSKMSAMMNPEIQAITKKYANKKDQVSMEKQQAEMQAIYEKYGTSPMGGCSGLLIQMPVLFGMYAVIRNVPAYVDSVKQMYMPLVDQIMATDGFRKIMEGIGTVKPVLISADKFDYTHANTLIDVLYKFQNSTWDTLVDKIPSISSIATTTQQSLEHINNFFGINMAEAPLTMFQNALHPFSIGMIILAVIIPIMAGVTQFASVKLQPQQSTDPDNPMANSMKSMMFTMPLFSVFMCFTLPSGLGLYWCISAVVRCAQQIAINKYLNTKTTEELFEENQKKAAKKREKKGTAAKEITQMAKTSTRTVEPKKSTMTDKEREEKLKAAEKYTKNAKAGSLASKANMVRSFNSGSDKDDK
ncbi:YidC/Oxa1 family membrane protein insertase [Hespellia stercorisuis]|uniref:YidC/Oxa1 family membrane protein insertase n=1 Tax=Hespellia stercorisuis DSM 15480 TaxID=1121950 RepID=A0A1M6R771_9FIRM|nr:YidC/Oxa1 family membrane protein insertase [Hespellia stercorisuis]SHK28325.1 YidC/Oxa1 family membrane protein insertase [Hespellia stercorisuis DSM 15480]